VLERLRTTVGDERLVGALAPRRRRANVNERVLEEAARDEVRKALDGLARLGFVDLDGDDVRIREPVMRFAEVVRGAKDIEVALEELLRQGRAARAGDDAQATEDEP
jgi:chromosome condensin MukBEF MukE localization factor